jgi:hypothetical protein
MTVAPPRLAERLEALFTTDGHTAALELEALVRETVALVEVRMPAVDTTRARRFLGEWQRPWRAEEG